MIRHPDEVVRDPEGIRALIVAVDKYNAVDTSGQDLIPELRSPFADALDILRWLGELGVPRRNTIVHLASRSPHRDSPEQQTLVLGTKSSPDPEPDEVRLVDAKRDSISRSVAALMDLAPGTADGLIVFLLGHGFQLPKRPHQPTTRVFLTEDYEPPRFPVNISVEDLAETLRHTSSFTHVTVLFDACSVQPFGDDQRDTVEAMDLDIHPGTRNRATGVALCSASGQLELAQESLEEGEGSVFLAAFLEATEPDHIEDDFIGFEGEQPVLDLRRVMERSVIPRVQGTTEGQNPELIPLGAYLATGAMPLYLLNRQIDKTRFMLEQRVRDAGRAGGNWVETALDRRQAVARIRGMCLCVDRFREATAFADRALTDSSARRSLIDALLTVERDVRTQAEALDSAHWTVTGDMTDELRVGRAKLSKATDYADLAREPDADPVRALALAGPEYQRGSRELRLVMEVAYVKAVWDALRNVVNRTSGLDADDAVRILGQWVAVADAPYLSSKADDIASRVGTGDGSPGLLLLKHHGRLEHEQWWMREPIGLTATTIADDLVGYLEGIRAQADALMGDAAAPLQEAIRRLLEAYPAVSDALDRIVLEALTRRASSWRRRATG